MRRDDIFSGSLIGFEEMFSIIGQSGYPPYNLVKESEDKYYIELALAGFKEADISITYEQVPVSSVVIEGKKEEEDERDVFHKGISTKPFMRSFGLGQYLEVTGSTLTDGLLTVYLERNIPEEKKTKTFKPNVNDNLLEG